MYCANNDAGVKTSIDEADEKQKYICPACGDEMIQKRGKIVAHHFAHRARTHCDAWYSGKISSWHKEIQSLFPKHCQEIVVWNREHTEYHIADVVFSDAGGAYVIEFQHTPISHDEFIERTSFYLNCGYSLIWIFDYCEIKKQKTIYYSDGEHASEIRVIWPGKDRVRFMDAIDFSGYIDRIHIYFYISTGRGQSIWSEWGDYPPREIWEYRDPFNREQLYIKLNLNYFESTREFDALHYTKKDFYHKLRSTGQRQN